MNLDDRKKKILSSVVEDYIVSAEPVGSKTLATKYNLEYSSATIRNEMKFLKEAGYLEQPHISSGSIPSTKGYRYYVDNLMKEKKLSMLDINYIENNISGFGDTETLVKQAAQVVSKILSRPTVLTLKSEDLLEHIKILKVSDKLLLVILLSKNGTVKDVFAKLTDSVPEEMIDELSSMLNTRLNGTPLEKLNEVLNQVIKTELSAFSNILANICESIKYQMNNEEKKLNADVEEILGLPEFSDVEKAKKFVNILSTKDIVDSTIEKIDNGELGIVIGSESKEVLLKDYSIISLNIETKDKHIGKLSVISPKRIDYSKTVSTLKYIDKKLKSIFLSEGIDKKESEENINGKRKNESRR